MKTNGYDPSDDTQRSLCLLHYEQRSEAVAAWYAAVGVEPYHLYEHQAGLSAELAQIEKFYKDIRFNKKAPIFERNPSVGFRLNQNNDYTLIPADKNADCA